MDDKEFVKKHGWDTVVAAVRSTTAEETAAFESKELKYLDDNNPMLVVNIRVYAVPYNDVKTLVDAYELVQSCGGLAIAKQHLKDGNVFRFEEKRLMRQAIQLVESVNEND